MSSTERQKFAPPQGSNDPHLEQYARLLTDSVRPVYDPARGRRLVANRDVKEGELIFTEEAIVFSPDGIKQRQFINDVFQGTRCAYCARVLSGKSSSSDAVKTFPCRHGQTDSSKAVTAQKGPNASLRLSDDARGKGRHCNESFCSKRCRGTWDDNFGSSLCVSTNPAYKELVDWCTDSKWSTPCSVYRHWLRILVAFQHSPSEGSSVLSSTSALASMNERDRQDLRLGKGVSERKWGKKWREAHGKVVSALASQVDRTKEKYRLHNNKNSTSSKVGMMIEDLTSFESFLTWLGRIECNQADGGGMFLLFVCMNHSCDPSVHFSLKPPPNSQLPFHPGDETMSRLFVIARRDIKEGEEVTDAYVDIERGVFWRRSQLRNQFAFDCSCERCGRELPVARIRLRIGGSFLLSLIVLIIAFWFYTVR